MAKFFVKLTIAYLVETLFGKRPKSKLLEANRGVRHVITSGPIYMDGRVYMWPDGKVIGES